MVKPGHTIFLLLLTGFCLISSVGSAQTDAAPAATDFRIREIKLLARDVKLSAIWYKKYLNLTIRDYKPNEQVKMVAGDFQLFIRQGKNLMVSSQIELPTGKKYINGITKIGFSTNQFQEVYDNLVNSNQKILETITEDKNLQRRYFLTRDTDGNQVQIFEGPDLADSLTIQAMFFCIRSSDYINTMKWYEENFDFEELKIIDNSKLHYQKLLRKGEVIFELLYHPYESLETTEFMPLGRDLAGFEQLIFRSREGKNSGFDQDNNANNIQWLK